MSSPDEFYRFDLSYIEPTQPLLEWLRERYENCLNIAKQKTGEDQMGWLDDAYYFRLAIEAVSCYFAQKLDSGERTRKEGK